MKTGKKGVFLFLSLVIVLVTCMTYMHVVKNQTNGDIDRNKQQLIKNKEGTDSQKISENKIIWAIPEDVSINEAKIKHFNQALYKAGYDFSICFKAVSYQSPFSATNLKNGRNIGYSDYRNKLENLIKNNQVDIVSGGNEFESECNTMEVFCRKGYFYSLNDYLASKEGKKVYQLYDEEYWDIGKVDGEIYTFPNETYPDFSEITAFNKKYVSKELAESWDGTLEGMLNILDRIDIPDTVFPTSGGFSLESLFNELKWEYHWGFYYDTQQKKIGNPFNEKKFEDLFRILHQMYQKGYLLDWQYLDDDDVTEEISQQLDDKKYIIGRELSYNASKDFILVQKPYFLTNSLTNSTMIVNTSKHKEEAVQLLSLLRTDDTWVNLFFHGQESVDYEKKENYITAFSDLEDVTPDKKMLFGLQDGVYPYSGENCIDYRKKRKEEYTSEMRVSSNILGFKLDATGLDDDIKEFYSTINKYMNCWREDDFEQEYEKARKVTNKIAKRILPIMQKQMNQWGKEYEKK